MPHLNHQAMRAAENGVTTCAVQPGEGKACYEPAHVVLFAPAHMRFAGRHYAMGDKILTCLEHGGQIYDAIHRRTGPYRGPGKLAWLIPAIDTNSLPAVQSPYQTTGPARPTSRPWTPRRPAGAWIKR